MKEKQKQTVEVMGTKLPKWQDCKWCGAKLAVSFGKFTYAQPCQKCKTTKRYEDEMNKPKEKSMASILSARQPAGVFEFRGRNLYINNKGNIIKDEKWKPLKAGK
jgi:uncharacterized protein YcbX